MEDRYEIRGKIGQGGLGAVYRGYDTRMNREVAIKRISTNAGEPELQEESTRQLIKEAGALASLQHPHIVTVYDVGSDEDGPYVVMELISGKTLDELIENAPLTWPDFRELALQTQEALIAAQELDLIHSDIKPSNLMLTWLPSGKFQIKIVDFGLATLTQSQSREELQELEAVFGSIFFMAPEQFERVPLDSRSDLYSMGCVYYQALAGVYPFNGTTGAEVMEAHLHHKVKPLQHIRADIPLWACDWIMWQINRNPVDRPESARHSLSVFLQNDKNPNPTMSLGSAQPASDAPKRPRLVIPGGEAATQKAATQSPKSPTPQAPRMIKRMPARTEQAAQPAPPQAPLPEPEPVKPSTAPQPLMPPEGSKPSVHTSSHDLPQVEPEPAPRPVVAKTMQAHAPAPVPSRAVKPTRKRKLSNNAKAAIAAALGLLTVLLGWYLLVRSGKNRETAIYNEMIQLAAKSETTELAVTKQKLELLLASVTNTGMVEARQTIFKALTIAKSTDGTDVDKRIAEFATSVEMLPDVRDTLIRDVLRIRKNPVVVPTLLDFAKRGANEPAAAIAAIQAIRFMATDEQFNALLELLETTNNPEIRSASEATLVEIIRKSPDRTAHATPIAGLMQRSLNDDVRLSALRLLGVAGGGKALEILSKALNSEQQKDQIAALTAIGTWSDDAAVPMLAEFIGGQVDQNLRSRAFDSALRILASPDNQRKPEAPREMWEILSAEAKADSEKIKIIRGLVNLTDDWVVKKLEGYADEEDDAVSDLAEKALIRVDEARKIRGKGK